MPPRSFDALIALFPGNGTELAEALHVSRQTLWMLQRGNHSRRPMALLRSLQQWFAENGTADGSPVPSITELLRSWEAMRRFEA